MGTAEDAQEGSAALAARLHGLGACKRGWKALAGSGAGWALGSQVPGEVPAWLRQKGSNPPSAKPQSTLQRSCL